jgi:hypothetical protein
VKRDRAKKTAQIVYPCSTNEGGGEVVVNVLPQGKRVT